MAKILGIDLGDVWTGIAISDASCLLARPLTAIKTDTLIFYLQELLTRENIALIIVGNPLLTTGGLSEQSRKAHALFAQLEKTFPTINWKLWDERLSSQRASKLGKRRTHEERLREQARAAAFILDLYLTHQSLYTPRDPSSY